MSNPMQAVRTFLAAAALCAAAGLAQGAEIHLRAQCQPSAAVVRLGDLAEIYSTDRQEAEGLAAVELFPAPPAGQQRFLRLQELQEQLMVRGVNLAHQQISGSTQIVITGAGTVGGAAAGSQTKALPTAEYKKTEQAVREALLGYLWQHGLPHDAWNIDFQLNDDQAKAVLRAGRHWSVAGGTAPLMGEQHFELLTEMPEGMLRFPLDARISRPPAVVVAVHSIGKGAVIRASDVQLASAGMAATGSAAVGSVEEVVGYEAVHAIPEGRPIGSDELRSPIMIRRGEVVTVYARSPGVRIKTVARARQEGSLGELIELESMQDRKCYIARVSGFQEAEVFARAMDAGESTADRPALPLH